MKSLLLVLMTVCLFAAPCSAQEFPRAELFGGYSYLHFPSFYGEDARSIPKGWAAGIAGNFHRHFGAEAAFSGHYETQFNDREGSTHLFLFGPKASVRLHNFTPWAHALFGTTVVRARAQSNSSYGPADRRASATHFAWAVGGGLDYPFQKNVALRVQADNIRNNLRAQFLISGAGGTFIQIHAPGDSGDLRVSVGMVFRVGGD